MGTIQTVRGAVDTADLGAVLMHEHIFVLSPEIVQNYPEIWGDEEKRVAAAIARMNELHSRGIGTVVDLTVLGLGRYIPRIQRIAAQTGINIVVATGIYTYNDIPHYFHYRGPGTILGGPEIMVEMFVRDIERGIGETGVRAGMLKCATDQPGVTPGVERVLRAVAQAHRHTGVPISTHTHARVAARTGAAENLSGGRRRSYARRNRAFRRHNGSRLSRRADRERILSWNGPFRHRYHSPV